MTKDEALRMALAALMEHVGNYKLNAAGCVQQAAAIAAIEEALAEIGVQQAPVPNGWVLAPINPTDAMIAAGGHINSEFLNDNAPIGEKRYVTPMRGVYKAMLEAAEIGATL